MKYLMYFLFCVTTLAETNYVYYSTGNNRPQFVSNSCTYDLDKDTVTLGDVTMGGIDWSVIRVAIFTDKIPKPFISVSQVTITPFLPVTENARKSQEAAIQITPAVKALMDLINETRPATNKITEARLISVVTNKIESMKAVAVEELAK